MAASASHRSSSAKMFYFCTIAAAIMMISDIMSINSEVEHSSTLMKSVGESGPVVSVRKHISFTDFNVSNNPRIEEDVKLLGSARVSREKGSIMIPGDNGRRQQAGRAIFSYPIRVFDPRTNTTASFETSFDFQLQNQTYVKNSSEYKDGNHGGSGLTFLIAPDEFTVGRSGPWLAMLNDACDNLTSKFIAIEFDTRMNPEFGDPNDNHIGINLGSVISQVTINASDFNLSFHDGSIHQVIITYNSPSKTMRIKVGSSYFNSSPPKTVYSGTLNLVPYLREYMFVGFSASTGRVLTQTHHILSWNFTSTSEALLRVPNSESCEDKLLRRSEVLGEEDEDNNKEGPSTMFFIFIAVGVLCFAVLINLYFYSKRPRRAGSMMIMTNPNGTGRDDRGKLLLLRPLNRPRRFTFEAISSATKGFSESEILTVDEYTGAIYRGVVANSGNCQVAVKRFSGSYLTSVNVSSKRAFVKRARCLSRVKHGNLVAVLGWCVEKHQEFMLVYEYVFNGCLDKWLFGVGVLPWSRRLEVLRNVAVGLSHLHTCQLAHGCIRVNSVFLDVSFNALLGDFGLGTDLGGINNKDSVSVGSRIAADVFDFGVFILEVVAGRRRTPESSDNSTMDSSSSSSSEAMDLLDLAWIMHETDKKMEVLDKRITSRADRILAVRVLEIGLLCTLGENQGSRPEIQQVIRYLNNVECPIPNLPATRPVVLCPYNSAPNLICGSSYVCAPF